MSFDFPHGTLFALELLPKNVSLRNDNDQVVAVVIVVSMHLIVSGHVPKNLKMANGKTLVMKLTWDGDDMEL